MMRPSESLPMPASYFQLVLHLCGTTRELQDAIMEGTGLTSAALAVPGCEITLGQQLRQLRNLNRLLPPGLGLAVGARFETSAHGPLGFAAVSAPTLGLGLAVLERFTHVRNPSHGARGWVDGADYWLSLEARCPLEDEERLPLLETFLLSLQSMVESAIGGPITEARFEISGAAPGYAPRYRDYFHCLVRFGADHTALVIPRAWLDLPCPHADPVMHESCIRELEAQARRLSGASFFPARVESLMAASGDAGIDLTDAARRLAVSRRTLTRRLQESGTSFQEIREAHLKRRAQALLEEGVLTVAEVGQRIGYDDPANFGRAFRRWFRASPRSIHGRPGTSPEVRARPRE